MTINEKDGLDLDALRKTAEAATCSGRWAWFGNAQTQQIYLATVNGGRNFVMDFSRWGMRGAQPRFRVGGRMVDAVDLAEFEVGDRSIVGFNQAKTDESVYRYDIRGIVSPDAAHIATFDPPTILALLDHIAALTEQLKTEKMP